MDFSSFSKEEPVLPSDSDSDADYRPSGGETPSEEESGSEKEQPLSSSEEEAVDSKKRKRPQRPTKRKARRKNRRQEETDDKESVEEKTAAEDRNALTEEEEKKRADSLWADFKKDSGIPPKSVKKPAETNGNLEESKEKTAKEPEKKDVKENKIKITEVFKFAGEEVKVEKEVDADSVVAKSASSPGKSSSLATASGSSAPRGRGRGRGGGLSSVLSQLGKKPKIGTLEKSKLDWDSFKKDEGIEDDLKNFNRGKEGYLEKQDFLQRADLRQFEIEKSLRASRRSNR